MSQFLAFRKQIEDAISACLSSTFDYRQNHAVDEVPSNVIQGLVAQHIAPLGGKENSSKIAIITGRPDWRKNAIELVFRRALLNIAVSIIPVNKSLS
jgi:hypothetical protein